MISLFPWIFRLEIRSLQGQFSIHIRNQIWSPRKSITTGSSSDLLEVINSPWCKTASMLKEETLERLNTGRWDRRSKRELMTPFSTKVNNIKDSIKLDHLPITHMYSVPAGREQLMDTVEGMTEINRTRWLKHLLVEITKLSKTRPEAEQIQPNWMILLELRWRSTLSKDKESTVAEWASEKSSRTTFTPQLTSWH